MEVKSFVWLGVWLAFAIGTLVTPTMTIGHALGVGILGYVVGLIGDRLVMNGFALAMAASKVRTVVLDASSDKAK